MTKLLCVDTQRYKQITLGTVYQILRFRQDGSSTLYGSSTLLGTYEIKNNKGVRAIYPDTCFITLKEHRNKKLKDILS